MKKISIVIVFAMLAKLGMAQSPASFKHPGVFSSQAELDFIKSTVAANNGSPVVAGYQALANSSKGSLSYNPEPYATVPVVASGIGVEEDAFRRDAHATYVHAIKWVVTGNSAHRDKALQILNAWASTFQRLTTTSDKPNQPTLEASWALPIWIAGAEIMKTYNNGASGWSSSQITQFNSFVQKILTYVNGPIYQTPNWLISKGLALMSSGVFLNDANSYNNGYNLVQTQIDAITTSGQIPELTRDFVHSQYVLIGMTEAAEIAHQQGNNSLFTRTNGASKPRLLLGAEAYVKSLLGTGSPNYQSSSAWARKSAPYEILLARYTELSMDVPQTRNYVLNQNRVETDVEDHFIGWLSATHAELPHPSTQSPYNGTPAAIPGAIEAENFDNGGEGVAYHDNDAVNSGGQGRTNEGVDTEVCSEGGLNVGWTSAGEWLEYTVNVTSTGLYNIDVRTASINDAGTFHIEFGGVNKTGTLTTVNTGGWQNWTTVSKTGVSLTAGTQVMRIYFDNPNFNINKITISSAGSSQTPYNGVIASIPGKVEAENYDNGGQDVAYNDITSGNTGNAYRTDNVDIQSTTDTGGGYAIGWIAAGEWLEYTVNVTTPGTYTVTARVSATTDGKSFHLELDGQNIGSIPVTNTGSYQTYATVTITTPSLATGQKVLRIVMDASSFNINYLNFSSNNSGSNIALNKPATASSIEATGFEATNAVDGSGTTRWSSAFSDPQWLQVDLGGNYNVNRVKITWEAAYAAAYQILISTDGSNWNTMRSVSGNSALVNDQTGLSGTGRYIRINGTARGTVYGYSIFELEVYGSPSARQAIEADKSDFENAMEISLFPNPASDKINIELHPHWNGGQISLINTACVPVLSDTIRTTSHTFDVGNLAPGLYVISVTKGSAKTSKLVLKK